MCATADARPGIEALEQPEAIRCSPASADDGHGMVTLEELTVLKKPNTPTHTTVVTVNMSTDLVGLQLQRSAGLLTAAQHRRADTHTHVHLRR